MCTSSKHAYTEREQVDEDGYLLEFITSVSLELAGNSFILTSGLVKSCTSLA